jgi:2-polyprenyl-3-methyl-5-hydroxy-6-metoxy-1,4-benzoquinol methylase
LRPSEDPYRETQKVWDNLAHLYQERFMNLTIYNESYAAFCALLPPHPSILEIGCGPGNITKYLVSKRPDSIIEAIDTSPQMIALAKTNNPSVYFNVMDCREIHSINKQFHAIVCGFCLPYLSETDCSKLIYDCATHLVPNGILYMSFVAGETSLSGYKTGSTGDSMYFYYHELGTIQSDLKANGFKDIQTITVDYLLQNGAQEQHTIVIAHR